MSNKLVVGNLSSSMTVADLTALFARFGPVECANVENGMATVQMSSDTAAEQAKKWLNFSNYDGLILSVRQLD